MDCYCDYDAPEFYSESRPVARKARKCSECRRMIQPGERYFKVVGKWDGMFDVFSRCCYCEAVAKELRQLPCFCDYFGGLYEIISDGWMDDLRAAKTGDYFKVMRLVAKAEKAKRGQHA